MWLRQVGTSLFVLTILSGCGPTADETHDAAYSEGYAVGYEEGQQAGKQEAIDCVRNEGEGAEDAANTCEESMESGVLSPGANPITSHSESRSATLAHCRPHAALRECGNPLRCPRGAIADFEMPLLSGQSRPISGLSQ